MVKRASEGSNVIRYGEGAAKLEGGALTKLHHRSERVLWAFWTS
jgi:hypothetical protein